MIFLKGKLHHLLLCHGIFIYGGIASVSVEDFDNTTQVTVVGSKKVYNLLNTVLQKKKMMQNDNKNRQIYNKLP